MLNLIDNGQLSAQLADLDQFTLLQGLVKRATDLTKVALSNNAMYAILDTITNSPSYLINAADRTIRVASLESHDYRFYYIDSVLLAIDNDGTSVWHCAEHHQLPVESLAGVTEEIRDRGSRMFLMNREAMRRVIQIGLETVFQEASKPGDKWVTKLVIPGWHRVVACGVGFLAQGVPAAGHQWTLRKVHCPSYSVEVGSLPRASIAISSDEGSYFLDLHARRVQALASSVA